MNEQFENSLRNRRRQLSRFHAQELILDYAENRLDSERKAAMDEFLPRDKTTQESLAAVRAALKYAEQLNRIEVSPELIRQVETTKLGWAKWADQMSWHNWPEVMRWSAEAVVIAAIFAAVISLLPMHKLARWLPRPAQEVILAEVDKAKDDPQVLMDIPEPVEKEPMVVPPIAAIEKPTPKPPIKVADKPTQKSVEIRAETPSAPADVAAVLPEASTESAAQISPPAQVKLPALNLKSDRTDEMAADEESPAPQPTGKGPKGFVYRAFMSATAVEETTNTVRDLILSLGGMKAGQVELGWRKNTGTYFHFSLPESNYESLLESLRAYSPVRIYKDPHWRVMPQGQIRLILFIEDLSLKK